MVHPPLRLEFLFQMRIPFLLYHAPEVESFHPHASLSGYFGNFLLSLVANGRRKKTRGRSRYPRSLIGQGLVFSILPEPVSNVPPVVSCCGIFHGNRAHRARGLLRVTHHPIADARPI